MRPRWIFLIAFALVCYGTGAAFIESFVNYASWHLIGADAFIAYHQFISPRVVTFLVAPLVLGTVFTILMLWFRPAAIPAWAVWVAIAAQAVVWVSTVTIQVPIQLQLSAHGLSVELVERLITTNFWLRRIPHAVCAGLFLWMAAQVIGDHRTVSVDGAEPSGGDARQVTSRRPPPPALPRATRPGRGRAWPALPPAPNRRRPSGTGTRGPTAPAPPPGPARGGR